MKTLKSLLMIATFAGTFVACQEEDLPGPVGSGISTVPNSIDPVDAEFQDYRDRIHKESSQDESAFEEVQVDDNAGSQNDNDSIDDSSSQDSDHELGGGPENMLN